MQIYPTEKYPNSHSTNHIKIKIFFFQNFEDFLSYQLLICLYSSIFAFQIVQINSTV